MGAPCGVRVPLVFRAYDAAAVQLLGESAVTNFNVHDIMATLPQPPAPPPAAAAAAAPDQAPHAMHMPIPGTPQLPTRNHPFHGPQSCADTWNIPPTFVGLNL